MAASTTNAELLGLKNAPLGLHSFLSLAPTTSASYPVKAPKSPVVKAAGTTIEATTPVIPVELKARRSSSQGSDGSLMAKKRFLKLGPVHFGEGDGDWSEEVLN